MKQGSPCDLEKKEKGLVMGLLFESKAIWFLIDLKGFSNLLVSLCLLKSPSSGEETEGGKCIDILCLQAAQLGASVTVKSSFLNSH